MVDEKSEVNLEGVITELLLRISTLERLLLEKKVFSSKEYSQIFENSVKQVTDLMKNEEAKSADENLKIFVPASNKVSKVN